MHYQYPTRLESTQPQSGSANRCRRSGRCATATTRHTRAWRDGARCHTAPAGVHSGDPDGACSSPREGAGLNHQSLRHPCDTIEFLVGKQLPYIGVSMASFLVLTTLSIWLFRVPVKGDFWVLALGAFLYVSATTALGLLVSPSRVLQIAALATAAHRDLIANGAVQRPHRSGRVPEGVGRWIGQCFPTSYFRGESRCLHQGFGLTHLPVNWQC